MRRRSLLAWRRRRAQRNGRDEVAAGSFREKEPSEIEGTGYVAQTLEAALWAFDRTRSYKEGALAVVNLGNDEDTTGAVYGKVAGAFYGALAISERWLGELAHRGEIAGIAERLGDGWPDT